MGLLATGKCPARRCDSRKGWKCTMAFSRTRTGRLRSAPDARRTAGECDPARSSALRASASQTAATSASVGECHGGEGGIDAQQGRGGAGGVRGMCACVDHASVPLVKCAAIRVMGRVPSAVRLRVLCREFLSRQPRIEKKLRKRRKIRCAGTCAVAQKLALLTWRIDRKHRKGGAAYCAAPPSATDECANATAARAASPRARPRPPWCK